MYQWRIQKKEKNLVLNLWNWQPCLTAFLGKSSAIYHLFLWKYFIVFILNTNFTGEFLEAEYNLDTCSEPILLLFLEAILVVCTVAFWIGMISILSHHYITNWQILGTFSKDLAFFDYQRKKSQNFQARSNSVTLWRLHLDLGP